MINEKERRKRGTQCTAALVAWLDEHGLAWIDNPNADQWGDKAHEERIELALERSGIEEMNPSYPIDDLEEFMNSIAFRSGRLRDAIFWDADLWIFKVKETGIADWNSAWRAALEDGIDTGSGDCLIPAFTTWKKPPAIPEFVGPDEPLNSYNRRARRMMEERALRQKEQTRREIIKKQVYWSFVLHWWEENRPTMNEVPHCKGWDNIGRALNGVAGRTARRYASEGKLAHQKDDSGHPWVTKQQIDECLDLIRRG